MLATLSLSQARFAELLEQTPWLEGYWDFDTNQPKCDIERLKNDMGA